MASSWMSRVTSYPSTPFLETYLPKFFVTASRPPLDSISLQQGMLIATCIKVGLAASTKTLYETSSKSHSLTSQASLFSSGLLWEKDRIQKRTRQKLDFCADDSNKSTTKDRERGGERGRKREKLANRTAREDRLFSRTRASKRPVPTRGAKKLLTD